MVRQALSRDSGDVAQVYVASAEHHAGIDPAAYRVPDAQEVAAHYGDVLSDDSWMVFVAESRIEGIVGHVEVHVAADAPRYSMLRPRRIAHVGIAVLPSHRGAGLGRRLMREAERWAGERAAEGVLLDLLSDNLDARRFYEKLGYREFGTLMLKEFGPQ